MVTRWKLSRKEIQARCHQRGWHYQGKDWSQCLSTSIHGADLNIWRSQKVHHCWRDWRYHVGSQQKFPRLYRLPRWNPTPKNRFYWSALKIDHYQDLQQLSNLQALLPSSRRLLGNDERVQGKEDHEVLNWTVWHQEAVVPSPINPYKPWSHQIQLGLLGALRHQVGHSHACQAFDWIW